MSYKCNWDGTYTCKLTIETKTILISTVAVNLKNEIISEIRRQVIYQVFTINY